MIFVFLSSAEWVNILTGEYNPGLMFISESNGGLYSRPKTGTWYNESMCRVEKQCRFNHFLVLYTQTIVVRSKKLLSRGIGSASCRDLFSFSFSLIPFSFFHRIPSTRSFVFALPTSPAPSLSYLRSGVRPTRTREYVDQFNKCCLSMCLPVDSPRPPLLWPTGRPDELQQHVRDLGQLHGLQQVLHGFRVHLQRSVRSRGRPQRRAQRH